MNNQNQNQNQSDDSDTDELEISILTERNRYNSINPNQNNSRNNQELKIHKIPHFVRELNSSSYDPQILSIGPYHWTSPFLSKMENPKWHCLRYILRLNPNKTLEEYLTAVSSVETEAREFYNENVLMEKHEFIQMLLLDGCFILSSLYGTTDVLNEYSESNVQKDKKQKEEKNVKNGEDSAINFALESSINELEKTELNPNKYRIDFNLNGTYNQVFHDLLLLENQIPYFVIKKIYDVLVGKEEENPGFLIHVFDFIENDFLVDFPIGISKSERPKYFHHLLHLCHLYFKPTKKSYENHKTPNKNHFPWLKNLVKSKNSSKNQPMRWRRAVDYYESGIEIRVSKSGKSNPGFLLDITFQNGVLEIPGISILDSTTESLFRNLLALEQTCPEFGNDFTAYIIMMSQLVSNPDDSSLLIQNNVITHMLESDESISDLLTDLGKNVIFDFRNEYYLKGVMSEMEGYYGKRRNKWMAWLWRKKFKNPWLTLVKIGAIITVIATVVTTVCSILVYVKPLEVQLVNGGL